MATSSPNNRRRPSGTPQRRRTRGSQQRRPNGERKPLQGRDTGYRVGSSRRQRTSRSVNPRVIVVGIIGILLIIGIVFGITSCVRGCSKRDKKQSQTEEVKVNAIDKRVAYGVSADETAKIGAVLDRNETFSQIAKNADKITDSRIIDLAINEPEAIDFVAGYLKSDGSTEAFGETVRQGEFPMLFTFDERWGYAPYADSILGVTGSGPVALSMAVMGVTGDTSHDPASIAKTVSKASLDSGATGMEDSFITNHAADYGVSITSIEATSDGIYTPIAEAQPVLIKLKENSGIGTTDAHWALITSINADNSITVFDPTSTEDSSHSWSLGAVSGRTDAAYSVTVASSTSPLMNQDQTQMQDGYDSEGYDSESYDSESYDSEG